MGRTTLKELVDNPLVKKQNDSIKKAAKKQIAYDENCQELSDEQLSQFRRVHYENQIMRRKEVISIRVLPSTIKKAKALGPGYTNILAKLIDLALDDPELIKKCL